MAGPRNNVMSTTIVMVDDNTTRTTTPLHLEDLESQLPKFRFSAENRIARRSKPAVSCDDSSSSDSSQGSLDESATSPLLSSASITQKECSRLLFGAAGIYGAYLYYGHVQEDLFRYQSEDGQYFRSVWMLQTLESAANIVVGLFGRYIFGGRPNLSLRPFIATGFSQVFAKVFTSLALAAGLSFPVCILAKSAKIVPVMLGQLMLGGSQYAARDYLFAALVVGGTALLSVGSKKVDKDDDHNNSTPAGLLFILLSLVMDGITAGFQKRLKRTYSAAPPTTYDFLLFTNLAMGAIALAVSIGTMDLIIGYHFLNQNPIVAQMIIKVCICSAIGQSFVFYVVATFDPMVCSTITTTRKMLSVVWSVVSKGHELSNQGTLGLALALSGLLVEMQGKLIRTKGSKESTSSSILHDKMSKGSVNGP